MVRKLGVAGAALLLITTIVALLPGTTSRVADPVGYVDPFVGTAATTTETGVPGLTADSLLGQAFPGATLPFGMVQWSPDTNVNRDPIASYLWHRGESTVAGFSLLHNSGIQYRFVPFLPLSVPVTSSPAVDPGAYYGHFRHADESATPGTYSVTLQSKISVALTATDHGGLARFSFPPGVAPTVLLSLSDTAMAGRSTIAIDPSDGHVDGYVTVNGIRLYYAAVFDQKVVGEGTYAGSAVAPSSPRQAGDQVGGWVSFSPTDHLVDVQVAVSYVSLIGAEGNLAAEIGRPRLTFTRAAAEARAAWSSILDRFAVTGGTPAQLRTFYSNLYESLLQPNLASDVDGEYRGWDGRVRRVPTGHAVYTDISTWDMARSQLAFLATFFPTRTGDMMASLVDAYQQTGGWARRLVVGTKVENPNTGDWALPAMAYLLGVRGFDARAALQIAVKTATDATGNPVRPGLGFYQTHGWVPSTLPYSAEDTLDYATTDFVVARFAAALGDTADAATLGARAANWRQVFDPALARGSATGFVWSRSPSGAYTPGWSPAAGNCYGPFEEGSSAQYSFAALTDLQGVIDDMGGPTAAAGRLDSLLSRLNDGCLTSAAWLGNEPSFALPWLYDWVGQPSRTQAVVGRVTGTLFSDAPAGLPGNDDWGAMSTCFVWAALGMYPVIPGVPGVALATPMFTSATLRLGNGRTVRIDEHRPVATDHYVEALTLDGRPYPSPWLALGAVTGGVQLSFDLGPAPATWGSDPPPALAPPSPAASPASPPPSTSEAAAAVPG